MKARVAWGYIFVQIPTIVGAGFEHASTTVPRQFQKLQLPLAHSLSQRQTWAVKTGAMGHRPSLRG